MPARQTARKVLMLCRTRGAWSDAVLREQIEAAGLDRKDAALCTTLCCGVLQNRALLDYYIDGFLTGRKHLQPALRDILRLAVYQIRRSQCWCTSSRSAPGRQNSVAMVSSCFFISLRTA